MIDASMLIWPGLILMSVLTVGLIDIGIQTCKDSFKEGYDAGHYDANWPSSSDD